MNHQDPFNLNSSLEQAFTSREARDAELIGGFTSTTPYDEEALQEASDKGEIIEVTTPSGNRFGLELRRDMADGIVTANLATMNGVEPTEREWQAMGVRSGHTGYKHTISRADNGMIAVAPGYRGAY
jgi:hypothetical protein